MNQTMRFLRLLTVMIALVATSAFAENSKPQHLGEGLMVPWPFPWAEACPVNWESMAGRYELYNSARDEEIDIKITIEEQYGTRRVHVSRYTGEGDLVGDGTTYIGETENVVSLWLYPTDKDAPPTWATLKLYYSNESYSCGADTLVPILTLEFPSRPERKQKQFRLVRLNPH